ncbi:MAG: BamA/TamA family outer membrane protein [Flavobacteriales bacterium]|nr:BamA/TamA family outer membrane protein [Flavobacteriales bacterium]
MLPQVVKFSLVFFFLLQLCGVSYSQENTYVILKEFKIIGNKTTKENIIVREMPFRINDTIDKADLNEALERTKSNLFNTSLFNFVTVEPVYFDSSNISIYITVEERWYWWPIPIFDIEENNFNTWWLDKDFDKVNYGLFLSKENFRGRKETFMLLLQGGYTEKMGFKYIIPYINKKKTNGLNIKFTYSRNHEVNYATTNNVRDYYRSENEYVKKEINSYIGYEIRPKLYNKHIFYIEYTDVEIADSIEFFNTDYLSGGKNSMQFFSFNYTVKRDKRNNKNYPTKGYYYDLDLYKDGLGLLDSKLNSLYLTSHAKKFWQLTDRFYFSASMKGKVTSKEGPYFLYNGLGYRSNIVRGYELYVMNGEHYGMMKTQLRYALLKEKVFNVRAIPAKKFNKIPMAIYMGAFFDAGYVDSKINNRNNFLVNSTLYGGGFSMDFVSYYDLVLRVDTR